MAAATSMTRDELCAAIRGSSLSLESFTAALALGVCARCCLRFAAISDTAIYACVLSQ